MEHKPLTNKRGYTVQYRIEQDIDYARNIEDRVKQTILATKALGAADLAVEFGLITYSEWEHYIDSIFKIA